MANKTAASNIWHAWWVVNRNYQSKKKPLFCACDCQTTHPQMTIAALIALQACGGLFDRVLSFEDLALQAVYLRSFIQAGL
jgi:hypothetical protein